MSNSEDNMTTSPMKIMWEIVNQANEENAEMPESDSEEEERPEAGRPEEPEIRELKYNFHCIEYYKWYNDKYLL